MRDSDVGSNPAAIIIRRIGGTGIRTRLRTEVLRVRLPYGVRSSGVIGKRLRLRTEVLRVQLPPAVRYAELV